MLYNNVKDMLTCYSLQSDLKVGQHEYIQVSGDILFELRPVYIFHMTVICVTKLLWGKSKDIGEL